jgi:hypothetical protein
MLPVIQRTRFVLVLLSFWALSVRRHHQSLAFRVQRSARATRSIVGVPNTSGIIENGGRCRIPPSAPLTNQREALLAHREDDGGNPPTTKTSSKTTLPKSGHRAESGARISLPYRRPLQQRRPSAPTKGGPCNRKPRFYWKDVQNIEQELRGQWEAALMLGNRGDDDVERNDGAAALLHKLLPPDRPPPIPNEALLNHWKRNDLRAAIRQFGRPYLAELLLLERRGDDGDQRVGPAVDAALTDAMIVPGKWKEAVRWPIVRHVVQADDSLCMDSAPPSSQRVRLMKDTYNMTEKEIEEWMQGGRWQYRNSTTHGEAGRREKGYWSKKTIMNAL